MNDKHSHGLLRPVKLKDLQVGDVLILKDSLPVTKSSVAYKANKFVVLRFSDGSENTCYQTRLEIDYVLAPLCWVEGKPVYPGDGPLYYKHDHRWWGNTEGVFASSIRDDELRFRGGIAFPISGATWTGPSANRHFKLKVSTSTPATPCITTVTKNTGGEGKWSSKKTDLLMAYTRILSRKVQQPSASNLNL